MSNLFIESLIRLYASGRVDAATLTRMLNESKITQENYDTILKGKVANVHDNRN